MKNEQKKPKPAGVIIKAYTLPEETRVIVKKTGGKPKIIKRLTNK